MFTMNHGWTALFLTMRSNFQVTTYIDRANKHGGGVCAFVRQEYKAERLPYITYISESGLHQLWLKSQVRNFKSFLVRTAYRPPNTCLECFDSDFSNMLVSALSFNLPVYILGDLNCNLLCLQDPAAQALMKFCSFFNLSQVINCPTRITESTETLIDIALVSNADLVKECFTVHYTSTVDQLSTNQEMRTISS